MKWLGSLLSRWTSKRRQPGSSRRDALEVSPIVSRNWSTMSGLTCSDTITVCMGRPPSLSADLQRHRGLGSQLLQRLDGLAGQLDPLALPAGHGAVLQLAREEDLLEPLGQRDRLHLGDQRLHALPEAVGVGNGGNVDGQ